MSASTRAIRDLPERLRGDSSNNHLYWRELDHLAKTLAPIGHTKTASPTTDGLVSGARVTKLAAGSALGGTAKI